MNDEKIPKPFRIEHLCCLPPNLARTHLVVRPVVAFLHADQKAAAGSPTPTVEDIMIPRLDAREVAAVFTAPFYNFLKLDDLPAAPGETLPLGPWYDGFWHHFKDHPWRVHNFYVPVNNQKVAKPSRDSDQADLAEKLEKHEEDEGRFKVWGMTAKILVDAARIGYGEDPEMEHNDHYGDDEVILAADEEGNLTERVDGKKEVEAEAAKM